MSRHAQSFPNTYLRQLFDLIAPPVCVSCQKVGAEWCKACRRDVVWVDAPVCHWCGNGVASPLTMCKACFRKPLPIQVRAALWHIGPIRPAIHRFKYEKQRGLTYAFAEIMAQGWSRWQLSADLLIPIPLHPRREMARGYNQAQLLAEALASLLNIPSENHALFRLRDTHAQAELGQADRLVNVRAAFSALTPKIIDQHIVLIDDVCTTGSTLVHAAHALLQAGAATVRGFVLSRALLDNSTYSDRLQDNVATYRPT